MTARSPSPPQSSLMPPPSTILPGWCWCLHGVKPANMARRAAAANGMLPALALSTPQRPSVPLAAPPSSASTSNRYPLWAW